MFLTASKYITEHLNRGGSVNPVNIISGYIPNPLNGFIDHAANRMGELVQKIFLFCVAFKVISRVMETDLKGMVYNIKNFIYPAKSSEIEVKNSEASIINPDDIFSDIIINSPQKDVMGDFAVEFSVEYAAE